MRERLIRLGGGLAEIFKQRLKFPTDLVHVVQGFFQLGAVFFEHSARAGERGGKVGAILGAQEIVYARNRLFHFRGPIVQVAKQCLSLGIQVIELCSQSVEVDILLRREQGTAYRPWCLCASWENLEVIVPQRAHAHNLYAAVDFDGKVSLNAEDDVQPSRVL